MNRKGYTSKNHHKSKYTFLYKVKSREVSNFAGPSLKILGGYYKISGGLSFTRAKAQTALLRVVTPVSATFCSGTYCQIREEKVERAQRKPIMDKICMLWR